jgi:hypothetical protein
MSVAIELLNAMVFILDHIDVVRAVDGHAVRSAKLLVTSAPPTPLGEEISAAVKLS